MSNKPKNSAGVAAQNIASSRLTPHVSSNQLGAPPPQSQSPDSMAVEIKKNASLQSIGDFGNYATSTMQYQTSLQQRDAVFGSGAGHH